MEKSLISPLTGEIVVLAKRDLLDEPVDKAINPARFARGAVDAIKTGFGRGSRAVGPQTKAVSRVADAATKAGGQASRVGARWNGLSSGARTGIKYGGAGGGGILVGAAARGGRRDDDDDDSVGKAITPDGMPKLVSTSNAPKDFTNVSHANKLSYTRITPRRKPTGVLVEIHRSSRSGEGTSIGKMLSDDGVRSGRRLVGI